MADTIKTNLGPVTAYADAKAHGYTGTREEFGQLLANAGLNLKAAETAKADAEAAKQAAEIAQQAAASSASSASTSASTATTQAAAAKSSADAAASSATAAKASEAAAEKSAQGAAASESAAKAAQTAAETAKANADTAASNAAANATAAANSAADAKKTLESIPDDYSILSGKVDENTSGISELKEDLAYQTRYEYVEDSTEYDIGSYWFVTANGIFDTQQSSWKKKKIQCNPNDVFHLKCDVTSGTNVYFVVAGTNEGIDYSSKVEFNGNIDIEYTVPDGCDILYVSTKIGSNYSVAKKKTKKIWDYIDYLSEDIADIKENIYIKENVQLELTWISGKYFSTNGTIVEQCSWKYSIYDFDENKDLYVTYGGTTATGVFLITPLDNDSNVILGSLPHTSDGYTSYKWISPVGCKKIAISTRIDTPVSCFGTVIKTIEEYISGLDIKKSILNGKSWNAVGDSITYEQGYVSEIVNNTGILSTGNKGVPGTTVAISSVADSIVERVSGYSDAEYWSVFGGINDYSQNVPIGEIGTKDNTTFIGALHLICDNILTRTNRPKLILITPLKSYRDALGKNSVGKTVYDYVSAICEIGEYYSIPVVNLWNCGGLNSENLDITTRDGLHPNSVGTSLFADKIQFGLENLVSVGYAENYNRIGSLIDEKLGVIENGTY